VQEPEGREADQRGQSRRRRTVPRWQCVQNCHGAADAEVQRRGGLTVRWSSSGPPSIASIASGTWWQALARSSQARACRASRRSAARPASASSARWRQASAPAVAVIAWRQARCRADPCSR
jgi:hypothetical protein